MLVIVITCVLQAYLVLLFFGDIRNESRCNLRHTLFESLDGDSSSPLHQTLPKDGVVKVNKCITTPVSLHITKLDKQKMN